MPELSPIEPRFHQFRNPYHSRARQSSEPLLRALSYRPRVQVVPDRQGASIAIKGSYEGRVSVPVGSALWAISATSAQAAGFKLNLLDAGGAPLASEAAFFSMIASGPTTTQLKDSAGTLKTITNPLFVLPKYRILTEPGLIRAQIQNLASVTNSVQVALHFALPPRPGDPRNGWNDLMDAELELARHALRNVDLTTGALVTTSQTIAGGDPLNQPATTLAFNVSAVGDNIVIPAAAGYRIAVHQVSMYSTENQTIRFLQGTPAGVDLQGPLVNFAQGAGYYLSYQKEEPHFILDTGQPFVLNIAAGSGGATGNLSGFVKYRMLQNWGV
jgi:hypothetical protein